VELVSSEASVTKTEAVGRRARSRVWLALRVVVPVGAFAYLLYVIPLQQLGASLASVSLLAALASVAAYAFAIWVGAVRWRVLFAACGGTRLPGVTELFRLHLIGLFYNNYLPGGVGGDVVRAVATRDVLEQRGLPGALGLVLIERTLGLSGLLILLALGFWLFPLEGIPHVMLWSIVGLSIAAATVLTIANGQRIAPRLPAALGRLAASLPTIDSGPKFTLALLLSIVTQASGVILAGHILVASVVGHAAFSDSMVLLPLIGAAQYFPLTIGGAGVREAAFVVFYASIGVSKADALASSLLFAAVQYVVAAAGGVLHAMQPLSSETPGEIPRAS
jgi:glycosyltransferase 2 family protein